MAMETKVATNVKQAGPFFMVSNMEASLRSYIDGLGFRPSDPPGRRTRASGEHS